MEATNINEQIINAIEATNATVDQLVQQGNELCDDVDNLRAEDERLGEGVEANKKDIGDLRAADEAIRSSLAADKEHISANKEAIASQAKDLADIRAAVADLRSGLANDVVNLRAIVEAQAKEIADLRAIVSAMHATIGATVEVQGKVIEAIGDVVAPAQTDATQTDATQTDATQTDATPAKTDMAALIARIPKPDAVRTRATAQTSPAPSTPVVRKDAAVPKPVVRVQNNAVETRAYARQYMIENGAKVEQLRDPAASEATVQSDAFAAWLATR